MLLTTIATVMSMAWAGQTDNIRLNCNVSTGSDQQVQVIEAANGGYTLRELTTHGVWIERALSTEEWNSGGLKLTETDPGTATTLWSTPHGWYTETVSDGFKEGAEADCGW